MNQDQQKQAAAEAALQYVPYDSVIGIGTGSTVNYFIDGLAKLKSKIHSAVASSEASRQRLQKIGIEVVDLNNVSQLDVYIDGADEINQQGYMIKGGGAALTREKIVAAAAKTFICVADASKQVEILGSFPLPVEVIPMARSYVARQLYKLGGMPEYRQGVVTDNGNVILDVHNLSIVNPVELEQQLNQITGVVTNGIFAKRGADVALIANQKGVQTLEY